MKCIDCDGSGACDPCDGYGTTADSYPNAGDGRECEICTGDGICPGCLGTGTNDNDNSDEHDVRVSA
jgi:hypothetical protein